MLMTFASGGQGNTTSYTFRRGTTTRWKEQYGADTTCALLHQKRNTDTLESHYDHTLRQVDLAWGVFENVNARAIGQSEIDAPAVYRQVKHHFDDYNCLSYI